ncbi:MAG TPA: carbohydrate-binding protein [Verrucomicrobiae bacterium]|nr:carbohydrate-binding protein [Verrucomicrobiae bacterium]
MRLRGKRLALAVLLGACGVTTFSVGALGQVVRPIPVPGRIEAEHYDTNGVGISYYDDSPGNSGGVYRSDDVDVESTEDVGGGYNVGWIGSGEWLNYTLNVQTTAVYQLAFRVASANGTGNIQVALDGLPLCTVVTPVTGGWQNWQTVTLSNLVLRGGVRQLRLDFRVGGQNLNYVQVTRQQDLTGSFLRVSGKQIVNGQGKNVILRGVGLGNWMLQEPYMMDASGIVDNQQQLKIKIAELVGTSNLMVFYESWLTNYMREADVSEFADRGFNSIRLPMHYNLFTLPIEQEPVPGQDTWLTNGFKLVDQLLDWCEAHQLYLILDMHGCPGGQGHDKPIADYNPPAPSLWENTTNRRKLISLWREIAGRYANRQWIGGYDLINEPNWTFENNANLNGCNDQSNAPLRHLLMDLTSAIRQVDTNHIVFLAGNCWGGNYNGVLPPWDPNLVISFHKYWDAPAAESLQGRIALRDQWNLPLWLGETGENSNEWFRDVVRNAEEANIGWAWWPWKKIGTITGPVMVQKPAGYQAILNYWRNNGPKPSTNAALSGLLALAQAARFENCQLHPDVFDALLRPQTQGLTLPFKSNSVPGLIFAADYDLGRMGEAYFDRSTNNPHNSGDSYRNDAIDIESCSDVAPTIGFHVGWIEAGDWIKYSVTSLAGGACAFSARVAAASAGGSFYLEVGGSNVTGLIDVPATGGWQSWTTLPARIFTNTSPMTSFKLVMVAGGFNLNWVRFDSVVPTAPDEVTASATNTHALLNWNPSADATSYRVKRATTSGGPYLTIAANVAGATYSDTAVTNGVTYYYVVSAINAYGESANSSEVIATIPFPRLTVAASWPEVQLSWPNSATAFVLYTTTNLAPPVSWSPATNVAIDQGSNSTVSVAATDRARFFRLGQQ